MSSEEVAALAKESPKDIDGIEESRHTVLGEPESYRAYEGAFYGSLAGEPENDGERVRQGVGRYILGQEQAASEALAGVDQELARYVRARIALGSGHWDSVVQELDPLLKAHPENLHVRLARCEALGQLNHTDALEEELRYIEQNHADHASVPYVQGLLRETEGDYEEANRLFWQTLTIDSEHEGALFRLAYHESLRGEPETAIELYERLCNKRPVPVGGLINLGLLFEDAEDYTLAASCFQRILDFNPNHQEARIYHRDAMASTQMYYDEEKERKEDKRAQVLRIPVTDFELSVRSRNCLANMNVRTLGDLIRLSEQELLAFKNFGETSLHEIKQILNQKGLRLGMATPEEAVAAMPTSSDPKDRDSASKRMVADLDLSVRSRKALDFLGLRSIGDLAAISEARLLACKNFGQTSLAEIKKKLRDFGLSLKDS
jgi:DNA-directed RNA polymerase subunit alpha